LNEFTPDQPYSIAVFVIGAILIYALPIRFAIVPLALSISLYPSTVLLPPSNIGLTPQRVLGFVLLMRCLTTSAVRKKFKWGPVDYAAAFYFVMLTAVDSFSARWCRTGACGCSLPIDLRCMR
jgi:hypothetical protein